MKSRMPRLPTPADSLRPTQRDVAIQAGVTQATVSLALSNRSDVSAETRERIQAIARSIGYRPDPYLTGLSAYRKSRRPPASQVEAQRYRFAG